MCERCEYQRGNGLCNNVKAEMFNQMCPGITMGADIRECDYSKVVIGKPGDRFKPD